MKPVTLAPSLSSFRRVVVKVGSSLLVDQARGEVKRRWLEALCDDIATLHKDGRDVLVVSSGSIALGRTLLKLPRGALKLEDGQIRFRVGADELCLEFAAVSQRNLYFVSRINYMVIREHITLGANDDAGSESGTALGIAKQTHNKNFC